MTSGTVNSVEVGKQPTREDTGCAGAGRIACKGFLFLLEYPFLEVILYFSVSLQHMVADEKFRNTGVFYPEPRGSSGKINPHLLHCDKFPAS